MGWNVKSHSISFFDNNFEKQIEIIKRTNYFLNSWVAGDEYYIKPKRNVFYLDFFQLYPKGAWSLLACILSSQ